MKKILPRQVDTVIVGSGPSALILSYILHGHIPAYDLTSPHPDQLLHDKLQIHQNLFHVDVDNATEHFLASRFSYSTQALPINVLLDTLIRPLGDTDDAENRTCVRWGHDPSKAVPHIVVGAEAQAGGQWVDNPVKASWDIGTLSYAGMLSLPGYSFREYWLDHNGEDPPSYLRPSRREVTRYFATYPAKVGIQDAIFNDETLTGIQRTEAGFIISSHGITCKNLVLASGIFTTMIPPRPLLQPLMSLPDTSTSPSPGTILVVGSGFSAADVIISTPPNQRIVHIYKWAPSTSPSPLRACHQHAYPEYAGVYRKMKMAATSAGQNNAKRPAPKRSVSSAFDQCRDWTSSYEGLPNTAIIDVKIEGAVATVMLQKGSDAPFERTVSSFAYVVGRRGSLDYLDSGLLHEVCSTYDPAKRLSGSDLRTKANENLEVAGNVFIIGSLTGDTLIRFAYGGCVYAAANIMQVKRSSLTDKRSLQSQGHGSQQSKRSGRADAKIKSMNGLDGHETPPQSAGAEISDSTIDDWRVMAR